MARHDGDSRRGKEQLIDRRSLLKAAGGTAVALGAGSMVGSAGAQTGSGAETVVDLGDEGLSNGDSIDPYLDDHFQSGTEVHIPAGEYDYTGDGLSGDYSDAALIGSPEGVVFNRPDDPEETVRPGITAESGTVRLENITAKGKHGAEQSRWRVGAEDGATFEIVNVNMPDGTVDGSDSTGIYAGDDHGGTLWVKSCYFSNFGNVALYVSSPYGGANGQVIVEDCAFVNTGMAALRFASDDSICRNCYFEATEKAPAGNTGWNQRGIKIDDPGENVLFEDIDMYWEDPGTVPIQFDDKGEGGAGVFRNCRIQNESDTDTFKIQWELDGNWEGENVHLSGSADHDTPEGWDTVTGSDAEKPDREYAIWTPVDGGGGPGGPAAGAGSSSGSDAGEGSETFDRTLTLSGTEDNPDDDLDVSFTATEGIALGDEAEPDSDTITKNDDGSYTATSVELDRDAVDTYTFAGEITDYSITEGYDVNVSVDGEETTFEALVADDNGDGGGEDAADDEKPSDDEPGDGAAGDGGPARTLVIDGTSDPTDITKYEFRVSGDLEYDEERSAVTDDGLLWDRMNDVVTDGRAAGIVGNGTDAFRFSGSVESISIDGNASVEILEG